MDTIRVYLSGELGGKTNAGSPRSREGIGAIAALSALLQSRGHRVLVARRLRDNSPIPDVNASDVGSWPLELEQSQLAVFCLSAETDGMAFLELGCAAISGVVIWILHDEGFDVDPFLTRLRALTTVYASLSEPETHGRIADLADSLSRDTIGALGVSLADDDELVAAARGSHGAGGPPWPAPMADGSGLIAVRADLFGYDQPVVRVLYELDDLLRGVARMLRARELRFPSLLPLEYLDTIGYRRSFPRTLVVPVCEQDKAACNEPADPQLQEIALTPSACFHTYPLAANLSLTADKLIIVTNLAKVFRCEPKRLSRWRMNEFSVREFTFIGGPEGVALLIEFFKSVAAELVALYELPATIEIAHDPFFLIHADREAVRRAQIPLPSKFEVVYRSRDGHDVAVASLNHHGRFFGDRYRIRGANGQVLSTGCVGFGLERLALAVQEASPGQLSLVAPAEKRRRFLERLRPSLESLAGW